MKKKYAIAIILTLITTPFLVAILTGKQVKDNAMCASICKGDWVWAKESKTALGDVVILKDPLSPDSLILRRIMGLPGDTIEYGKDGDILINSKRIRQVDMGFYNDMRLIQENKWSDNSSLNKQWLTLRLKQAIVHKSKKTSTLKEHEYFLLADNRDQSLDSRWWGPVHKKMILGTIFLRVGESNEWRKRIEFGLPND